MQITKKMENICILLQIMLPVQFITTTYNKPSTSMETDLIQSVPKEMSSDSYLNTEKTRAILPMARILFRMTSFRRLAAVPVSNQRILKFQYTFINRFKMDLQFYIEIFIINYNTSSLQKPMHKLYNKMTLQLQLIHHTCFN
jgi:hypothetical protein